MFLKIVLLSCLHKTMIRLLLLICNCNVAWVSMLVLLSFLLLLQLLMLCSIVHAMLFSCFFGMLTLLVVLLLFFLKLVVLLLC
jgi:hypothetical protein